jgi:pimeloyl-ACP methyl ester carboxylesterase
MAKGENKKFQENNDPLVMGAMSTGAVIAALAAAIGGWIGYSALRINHRADLPDAIDSERETFNSAKAGRLTYYVDRSHKGRPLVVIHSINAAASAYEMRPLFLHYRASRPVYALDLPGFGLSDRSKRVYSPRLYTDAILDFLESQVTDGPVDVVALSLGSEFVARAALERPDLIHSLTLISPSGFSRRDKPRDTADRYYRGFSFPLWSQAFYDLIVAPASIKYFLKRSFQGKVDPGLIDYDYRSGHQPGARYAPLYFISGKLFSPHVREEIYEKLTLPVLVLYDRDAFVQFDVLPDVVAQHQNWHSVRITPTKGLPHWEKLDETTRALDEFWNANK